MVQFLIPRRGESGYLAFRKHTYTPRKIQANYKVVTEFLKFPCHPNASMPCTLSSWTSNSKIGCPKRSCKSVTAHSLEDVYIRVCGHLINFTSIGVCHALIVDLYLQMCHCCCYRDLLQSMDYSLLVHHNPICHTGCKDQIVDSLPYCDHQLRELPCSFCPGFLVGVGQVRL